MMMCLRHLLDWSVEIIQFSMQEQHKDLRDINGEMLIRMEKNARYFKYNELTKL